MTANDGHSGERVPDELTDMVNRLSHLEGIVWWLWLQGVIRIVDGKAQVEGVHLSDEWADLIPVVVDEFSEEARLSLAERARPNGRPDDE